MKLAAFITNLGKYNEGELVGEWINFPISNEELEAVYTRIGINFDEPINGIWYEEIFFTDYDCDFDHRFGEYESIEHLNEVAEMLEEWDENLFNAVCEMWGTSEALDNDPDNYLLHSDIDTEYDLGYYFAEETGMLSNVPEDVKMYFDYEAYGRDININASGGFTSYGWIEWIG